MQHFRVLDSRIRLSFILCVTPLLWLAPALRAQYQVTTLGSTITENFDTYTSATGTTAPTFTNSLNVNTGTNATQRGGAWSYFTASNTGGTVTSSTNFQVNDTGSCSTGSFRSYGATGSADRALGILSSGSFGTFNGVAGNTNNWAGAVARFDNATGGTITSLVVTYTGEQWRAAASDASFITVGFSVSSASGALTNAIASPTSGLTFNAISVAAGGALNGDAAGNRNTTFTATISGLSVLSGGSINLAFAYAGGAGSGSRQGLAIDDLTITASGTAAAASLLWSGASGDTWDTSTAKFASNATTWNNTTNAADNAEFGTASQNITVGTITAGSLKFSANTIALSGGTITNGSGSSFTAEVTNGSDTATLSTTLSGAGLTKSGSGTLVLGGTQSSLTGTVVVSAGTLQTDTTALANNNNITNNATLVFAQGSTGTYSGTLTNNGAFTKSGAGNLTISNAVAGSGSTSITAGTLTAGANTAIATGALTMSSGTTLDLGGFNASVSSLTMTGATISNAGTLTLAGALTTNASASTATIGGTTLALGSTARTFTIADGAAASDLTISAAITSATSGTLIKNGAGTLTLSGNNTGLTATAGVRLGTQGSTPAEGGTLAISNNNAVGSSSAVSFQFNAGTLNATTTLTLPTTLSIGGRTNNSVSTPAITGSDLTIAGAPSFFKATGTTGELALNVNNNTTLSGTFAATSGSGTSTGVFLGGTGTLTLTGANTLLTDNITLRDTLKVLVNGTTNGIGTGTVTVNSGATLGGSGTVTGATTINSGGTLAPGNSPGLLTFSGALTLAGNANFEINGTTRGTNYDAIDVAGLTTYGGTLNLAFGSGVANGTTIDLFGLTGGSAATFLAVAGTGSYLGSFTSGSGIWTFNDGTQLVTFTEGTGDLTFSASAVPEPATYAAIFGVVALLGVGLKRRREKQQAALALTTAL